MKDEEFVAIEAAVRAGTAPPSVVSALRAELKKLGDPESSYLKATNCPQYHRIFPASNLIYVRRK